MSKLRLLFKLSGEVLKGPLQFGIHWQSLDDYCKNLVVLKNKYNVELAFVVGGGNIFRGASCDIKNYNRLIGDNIGMLATVLNGLSLMERFKSYGEKVVLQSGIKIEGIANLFNIDEVEETFLNRGIVIFSGGIGNPYFSTDTTASLRALQINADFLVKATKVDGIYDKDPFKYNDAKKFDRISYDEILNRKLEIMDLTAIQLLQKNNMKLYVINMMNFDHIESVFSQNFNVGTIVEN